LISDIKGLLNGVSVGGGRFGLETVMLLAAAAAATAVPLLTVLPAAAAAAAALRW
jgi:hypothetical protein